jgi:2-polyprenyl-3-methyl-5-hydroxy-6-metoxy-1,4-benzoquinol methylase
MFLPHRPSPDRSATSPVDSSFFIKPGYTARRKVKQLADRFVESKPIVHQPDVYPLAALLAARLGCDTVVDIGCGGGGKLADLHPRFRIVGFDVAQNIDFCRASYSFGTWIERDLERPEAIPLGPDVLQRAVVVCSDVIEHLVDPGHLLRNLRGMLGSAPLCVLSNPRRDQSDPEITARMVELASGLPHDIVLFGR